MISKKNGAITDVEIISWYKEIADTNKNLVPLMHNLERVSDSYPSFVFAVLHYVRKKPERLEKVTGFIDNNPGAESSDILYFVSVQLDFYEDSVPQPDSSEKIHPLVFPDDVSKNQINRPWQIFDVIYDWDARIRGIIIEKVSDNTFRVLWTNDVIGEVEQAAERVYLLKNILKDVNEDC